MSWLGYYQDLPGELPNPWDDCPPEYYGEQAISETEGGEEVEKTDDPLCRG